MADYTINIHFDKKCAECGKGGAADSGICMACTAKAVSGRKMKSATGQAVQEKVKKTFAQRQGGK